MAQRTLDVSGFFVKNWDFLGLWSVGFRWLTLSNPVVGGPLLGLAPACLGQSGVANSLEGFPSPLLPITVYSIV